MEKKKVSVQIEGRSYAIITSEDKSYVQKVAAEVTECIRNAASHSTQLDTRDCAVLAALDFCDDRNKAIKKNSDVVKKADQIIVRSNELNRACSEYKEKLTEAINESTRLSKRVKALENQLKELLDENEKLRNSCGGKQSDSEKDDFEKTVHDKKAEKMMGYVPMRQYSLFDGGKKQDSSNAANNKSVKNKNDKEKN